MCSVIKSSQIMIGPFLNMKIVAKSIKKWHKMIEKRKSNNNFGANYFRSKTKIVFKMKKLLLKCLKKSTQSKEKRKSLLLKNLIYLLTRKCKKIKTLFKVSIQVLNKNNIFNNSFHAK